MTLRSGSSSARRYLSRAALDSRRSVEVRMDRNMCSRADVHREFGIAAEIAQAMEYDLGRVIVAHKGLDERVYVFDDPWAPEVAFVESVHRNTLGASISKIRGLYNLVGETAPLDEALTARNFLSHRFFTSHLGDMETDQGRSQMCEHLHGLQQQLWAGHQLARGMADFLVAQLEELQRDHHGA